MTDREFIYWLKGIIDTTPDGTLSGKQLGVVKKTLDEVINDRKWTGPTPHKPFTEESPYIHRPGFPPDITC